VYSLITKLIFIVTTGSLWVSVVQADAPPRVVVSEKPVHSVVAGLMEGVADPTLLVTSGSPLAFHPASDQETLLAQADLIIWVGPELEPGLAETLRTPPMAERTLELLSAPELKVLPSRSGQGRDPFFWLDTRNMLILLDLLTEKLTTLDAVRAHRYQENRLKVLASLSQIDRELEFGYKDVSATPVFLYHDTQQYFEQAYAMKVAGIASGAPGSETNTENLLQVRQLIADANMPCLLTDVGFPTPHLDLIGNPNMRRFDSDSLGTRLSPGPGLYVNLMRDHYRTIRECLDDGTAPLIQTAAQDPGVELYSHRVQGKYLLMNHFGEPVTNLDFPGRYQLIYFGYTFCPDICPTSLAAMVQALKKLGPKADRIQPLFITVDPERDTLEVLRKYTSYFHPRLLGLTGPPHMISRTADQFRVRYEKVVQEGRDPDKYAMDHTSSLFLLGPNSEFVAKFAHGLPADQLAGRLEEILADESSSPQ